MREWRASDHDRGDEQQDSAQNAQQPEAAQNPPAMPSLRELGISDVTLAAWKTNCTVCHGLIGRGDGPQGAMLRPPDLTNPEWQKKTPDDEIRQTITKGRGRMPAFSQLPADTVEGLVRLVRLLNSERPAEPEGAAPVAPHAPGAAPTAAPGAAPAAPAP